MHSLFLILLLLSQVISGQVQSPFSGLENQQRAPKSAYPEPIKIIDGPVHVRDPTLVYDAKGQQYIVMSTGNELLYLSSPNLTGPYVQAGSVLGNASLISSSYNPWAPDVTLIDGKFYVYYCVSRFGTQDSTIGLAISSSGEESSFHDLGGLFSTEHGNISNALDPHLVPGGEYLSYGSYFGGIYLAKLNSLTSIDQSSLPGIKIADGFPFPNAIEGSFIFHRKPWYYLFLSEGQCCGFNQHELPEDNTTE
ncbi:Arabinanase/levansucrase/invertase [Microstroma glucosiphilum]|uniref:Endo-1,5-alpha-L-arabinanase A n=1 Tax=Pseudomicrostroma glucosiphilum TaxID=1684307 RepID=A0A316UBA6_9BASI|nr:Arabinanase/levansucrase/invertase [Pseudomicrostroma glucosiphilum]PWN22506.1 Arabinanase/levansucrase/invertase [Pseudomicrostroma glucosiphilum]